MITSEKQKKLIHTADNNNMNSQSLILTYAGTTLTFIELDKTLREGHQNILHPGSARTRQKKNKNHAMAKLYFAIPQQMLLLFTVHVEAGNTHHSEAIRN